MKARFDTREIILSGKVVLTMKRYILKDYEAVPTPSQHGKPGAE
jgi:hypothetical protein